MYNIAIYLGNEVSVQNIYRAKTHQRQRRIEKRTVKRLEYGGSETGSEVKMFGRVMGDVHSPEDAGIVAHVMQYPVQKVLRYDKGDPVQPGVGNDEKVVMPGEVQYKKCDEPGAEIDEECQRCEIDIGDGIPLIVKMFILAVA